MELTPWPLWSVGKFLFLHDLYVQRFLSSLDTCCNEMKYLQLHCSLPYNMTLIAVRFLTKKVLSATAHLTKEK